MRLNRLFQIQIMNIEDLKEKKNYEIFKLLYLKSDYYLNSKKLKMKYNSNSNDDLRLYFKT